MNARALGAILLIIGLGAALAIVWMQAPTGGGGVGDAGNAHRDLTNKGENARAMATSNDGGPSSRKADGGPIVNIIEPARDEPLVLFGKVTIPGGVKLDGLEVELRDPAGELLASGDVNESGKYEVHFGRPLLPGWTASTAWLGIVGPDGRALAEAAHFAPSFQRFVDLHKPTDPPAECNFTIMPPAAVEGKVVSKATGAPIAGATVVALPSMGPWKDATPEEVETDEEGKFKLNLESLPLQEIYICCKAEGDEYQSTAVGPLELKSGETRPMDFQLEAAKLLKGIVVDDATGDPIDDATITLMPVEYSFASGFAFDRESSMTDKDGRFEVSSANVPLERAIVKIEAPGYAAAARAATAAACAEIRLGKPVVVQGKITDSAGKPVVHVTIYFSLPHEWTWSDLSISDFVKSDGEGKFTLILQSTPIEDAVVYIDQEPFAPFLAPIKDIQSNTSNATTKEITIALQPGYSAKPKK